MSSSTLLPSFNNLTQKLNCNFETTIFYTEIRENLIGRNLLTKLKTQNCENVQNLRYIIHQGKIDEFELNEESGEFFNIKPLDREKKGIYLFVINITYSIEKPLTDNNIIESQSTTNNIRLKRQSTAKSSGLNPIVECK